MAFGLGKNFQVSLVATAPSPATSGTSLVVTAGEGSRFDTPPFNALICPADAQPTPANAEVVRVTGISTDTLTITRAQESSSARTVVVGDRIYVGATAKTFTDIQSTIDLVSTAATTASTEVDDLAAVWLPFVVQVPVQRVTASAQITRGAINYATAPPALTASATANAILQVIPILASEMNVTGRTTKLLTKLVVGTDAVAPGINFTCSLILLSGSAGGNDIQTYSWGGTVVSNSTATVTTPAANSIVSASSASYTLPADGTYVIVISTSGTMATNARVQLHPSLWISHV